MHGFADHTLAEHLERFAASDVRELADAARLLFPEAGAQYLEVAGGVAGYVGARSPANGAIGLGFRGEVTQAQVASVETFFLDRGEEPIVSICPLAHPSLVRVLAERGWTVGTFENVLVRTIDPQETVGPPLPVGVEVREALGDVALDAWALMAANGFSAPEDPTQAERQLATAATRRAGARFLFGLVDGAYAGTGQLEIAGDLAWLSGDTTLPRFRRHGVQGALQRARLKIARDAGCSLAVTESVPGGSSQRNMERLGFRVAYTRVDARYPVPLGTESPKGTAA